MIGIINYGVGNLRSVENALNFLNIPNTIIGKPVEIKKCNKLILPGVGAFGPAIKKLNELGFAKEFIRFGGQKPILGICLGMQLLFEESCEYGHHKGLGLIKGKVLPFSKKIKKLPLPLIGWNEIKTKRKSPLLQDISNDAAFYFVHSFYCEPTDKSVILASTDYGIKFASIINKNNIYGCQFHPEKSQSAGLKILENFNKLI